MDVMKMVKGTIAFKRENKHGLKCLKIKRQDLGRFD